MYCANASAATKTRASSKATRRRSPGHHVTRRSATCRGCGVRGPVPRPPNCPHEPLCVGIAVWAACRDGDRVHALGLQQRSVTSSIPRDFAPPHTASLCMPRPLSEPTTPSLVKHSASTSFARLSLKRISSSVVTTWCRALFPFRRSYEAPCTGHDQHRHRALPPMARRAPRPSPPSPRLATHPRLRGRRVLSRCRGEAYPTTHRPQKSRVVAQG